MSEVGIYEAKTHFSKLVARARRGERITITQHGKPVAELIPAAGADIGARRKAIEGFFDLRRRLKSRGIRITRQEVIAWKNQGRR
jgi:prevent-host-death family protein